MNVRSSGSPLYCTAGRATRSGEYIFRRESGLDGQHLAEARQKKACAHQQNKREGNLCDNQTRCAGSSRRGRSFRCALQNGTADSGRS